MHRSLVGLLMLVAAITWGCATTGQSTAPVDTGIVGEYVGDYEASINLGRRDKMYLTILKVVEEKVDGVVYFSSSTRLEYLNRNLSFSGLLNGNKITTQIVQAQAKFEMTIEGECLNGIAVGQKATTTFGVCKRQRF